MTYLNIPRRSAKRSRNPSSAANAAAPMCGLCIPTTAAAEPEGVHYYAEKRRAHQERQQQQQQRVVTPKKHHQPRHHYGKTVSQCTTATATSSRSMYSSASSSVMSMEQTLCPVTGVYADINIDYYVCPKVIGKGHYGVVRECIHRATRQTLAVKSIEKSKIGRLDHLQREIYLLANVNHHSIMKMVDCYEDVQFVHIITEKYTGGELFDKIIGNTNSRGCLSERKTGAIIKSLLEAVAHLHDNGVVHRDIKPENILFESEHDDAAIKLIDFGLARRHDVKREGPMSNPVGTAYYMSPELLKGKYDKSCDIWSVGIVTYILLCGYPPFNGSSDSEIQDSTRKGKLQFSGSHWTSRSDDGIDFIKCLLRKDPRKRFSANEALMHPWIQRMSLNF